LLRRNAIFVDSARTIVKSGPARHERFEPHAVRVGMRQFDFASAMAVTSRESGRGCSEAPIRPGLIEAVVAARERPALAALLPDFTIAPRVPRAETGRVSGIVALSRSRHQGPARRRALALGAPRLLLGPGLLRAPPAWGELARALTATAHVTTGPNSPADFLDPCRLLLTRGWETPELLVRAANGRRVIVSRRLGGQWWNSGSISGLPRREGFVLMLAGESGGLGANGAPSRPILAGMLAAALVEHEARQVVILAPEMVGRLNPPAGFLSDAAARGCTVLTRPVDLWEAVERAACVYAAGGETGFLALLAGVKTRCFVDSFYAGWGLTVDAPAVPPKPVRRTVDELFAGACLVATRYLDPYRLKSTSFEDTLDVLEAWRSIEAANRRISVCVGMSFWKRRQVQYFLRSSERAPAFRRGMRSALRKAATRPGSAIAVWASRTPAGLAAAAAQRGFPLIRVEDGFIRSVGLGSDFMPAASLVIDSRGMHFDPSVRSDLETLLAVTEFDSRLIERARVLIAALVARGITKYNLGQNAVSIAWPGGQTRLLVPGQVEDDLSVRLGGGGISGNLDLLARVRADNPAAFILYKPHPDVEAGHRLGKIPDSAANRFADIVIRDVSTAALFGEIDELHTLTSLSGFEALLRRKRVVTYGRPFYAGWGLTIDHAQPKRERRLILEELVAGALILYPRYLDPVTRLPCGPELIIERLEDPELWRPGPLVLARRLQGLLARQWDERAGKIATAPATWRRRFRRNESGAQES
jgi:capsular polysaccharide export protein